MEKSESIKNLAAALAVFQVKCSKIIKTAENPFFKSKYADLPSILDEIALPLAESNLVLSQWPDGEGLTTMLMHTGSGEFISANGTMKPIKNDPQSMGSAITYQRRYSICSILGLNVDSDDDGNSASVPTTNKAATAKAEPEKTWLNEGTEEFNAALEYVRTQPDKTKAVNLLREKRSISKKVAEALING